MSNQTSEYKQHLELIREIKYFSAVSLEAQKVLAYLCVRETFQKGETVFKTGDIDLSAYHLLDGRLEIFIDGLDEPIGHFKQGDFFGALTLLGESPRLFTLKAAEQTNCIRLTKDKFTKVREQFPELSDKFMLMTVEDVNTWEKRFLKHMVPECAGCLSTLGLTLI
jgi:CRP-like cAMP-binding protein